RRRIAVGLSGELRLLELRIRGHAVVLVVARKLEHRVIERVEAGERDELELVAHRAQLALELRDRRLVELLLPIEARRAIVRQHLAGELRMNGLCKALRFMEIRRRSLAPHEIRVGREGETARDRHLESAFDAEEAFWCPLARAERTIAGIDVGGEKP